MTRPTYTMPLPVRVALLTVEREVVADTFALDRQ